MRCHVSSRVYGLFCAGRFTRRLYKFVIITLTFTAQLNRFESDTDLKIDFLAKFIKAAIFS